ncbi:hypothetical protein AHEV_146 [Adoxophyes honmai entomopoxvirus 'L']|uniref:Uncharacterized protein n=1 Tax=Adoxophyes honmai entomopoxvirus 'L' TaxID=1293540 RepID=A0A916NWW2_9POXV|nr:hypothetical protein AHEV_146 [Adoxophyes honmai entomopoxvirus 'L']CCU55467.1 hypothetical protein AHEV_146 [Adoxophyes honmai entomopoxvirus 'L']
MDNKNPFLNITFSKPNYDIESYKEEPTYTNSSIKIDINTKKFQENNDLYINSHIINEHNNQYLDLIYNKIDCKNINNQEYDAEYNLNESNALNYYELDYGHPKIELKNIETTISNKNKKYLKLQNIIYSLLCILIILLLSLIIYLLHLLDIY